MSENFHDIVAYEFDRKYKEKKDFLERYEVLEEIICKHGSNEFIALDVGCGSGVFLKILSEKSKKVYGIDGSGKMLEIATQKLRKYRIQNVSLFNCDLFEIDKYIKRVDLILCSSVLEYIEDFDGALNYLGNLLNFNGILIITLPNKYSFYRKLLKQTYRLIKKPIYYGVIKNIYSFDVIYNTLKEKNLKILEGKYFAPTFILSSIFRPLGLNKYSDNMFVVVAKKRK